MSDCHFPLTSSASHSPPSTPLLPIRGLLLLKLASARVAGKISTVRDANEEAPDPLGGSNKSSPRLQIERSPMGWVRMSAFIHCRARTETLFYRTQTDDQQVLITGKSAFLSSGAFFLPGPNLGDRPGSRRFLPPAWR